jgi:hypothetical protein
MLTEKELKLIRLALNPGAADGEWSNAAVMFFRSARARSAGPEEFGGNGSSALVPFPVPPTQPDWGLTVFPHGKHKGELFKDMSPSYLSWYRGWILDDPERSKKMKNLAKAIEAFLKQSA